MQEHTTTTRSPEENRRATNKQIFALYIGIEKYLQKKLKKFGNSIFCRIFVSVIKSNNIMKVLKSTSLQMKVKRSYDLSYQWAKVNVTECKTIYLVTVIVIGYELPSVAGWRISKKDAKDAFEAANIIAYKAYLRGEL